MGTYDGAEVCKLVGLLMLYQIYTELGAENVGLYRDDGLAVLKNLSGSEIDHMRKKIIKIF